MPVLPALLLRSAPRRAADAAGTAWLAPCRTLARQIARQVTQPLAGVGQGWRALPAPLPLPRLPLSPSLRRERALERSLDAMAGRVAQAELELLREQRRTRQEARRAEAAEAALVRLQDTLDQLRREQHTRHPASA